MVISQAPRLPQRPNLAKWYSACGYKFPLTKMDHYMGTAMGYDGSRGGPGNWLILFVPRVGPFEESPCICFKKDDAEHSVSLLKCGFETPKRSYLRANGIPKDQNVGKYNSPCN